jgi:toxin ParE1/3/4
VRRLVFAPEAEADLIDIGSFIAESDPRQADRLVDRIRHSCQMLSRFPKAGPLRPDIAPAVRIMVVLKYIVVYRVRPRRIEIVRIAHGARDLRHLAIS